MASQEPKSIPDRLNEAEMFELKLLQDAKDESEIEVFSGVSSSEELIGTYRSVEAKVIFSKAKRLVDITFRDGSNIIVILEQVK